MGRSARARRAAAEAICTSGRGAELVVGVAGSGKTTMLRVVAEAFEGAGYQVARHGHLGPGGAHLGQRGGDSRGAHPGQPDLAPRPPPAPALRAQRRRSWTRSASPTIPTCSAWSPTSKRPGPSWSWSATTANWARSARAVLSAPWWPGTRDRAHPQREPPPARHRERQVLAELRAGGVGKAVDWYVESQRVHALSERDGALNPPSTPGQPTWPLARRRAFTPGGGPTWPS